MFRILILLVLVAALVVLVPRLLSRSATPSVGSAAPDSRSLPRPHTSDHVLQLDVDPGSGCWGGWELRRSTTGRAWVPTCSGRPRAEWRSARRWWACCGPQFPTSSAAPAGGCGDRPVTVVPTPGAFGPALGLRPDSLRRGGALHIRPWLPVGTGGTGGITSRTCCRHLHGPLERTDAVLAMAAETSCARSGLRGVGGARAVGVGRDQHPDRRLRGHSGGADRGVDDGGCIARGRRPNYWPAAAATPSSTTGTASCSTGPLPGCPLFEIFDEAGGCGPPHPPEHGEVYMMRLLDPLKLLRRMCCQFDAPPPEAGLPRPLDLGLLVEGRKYQLELGPQGVCAHVATGRAELFAVERGRLHPSGAGPTRLGWGDRRRPGGVFDVVGRRGRSSVVPFAAALALALG